MKIQKNAAAALVAAVLLAAGASAAWAHAAHQEAAVETPAASTVEGGMPMAEPRMTGEFLCSGRGMADTADLGVPDVWSMLKQRLDRLGNKRLRVGRVVENGDTVSADVETVDGSLVTRCRIDRRGNVWRVVQ